MGLYIAGNALGGNERTLRRRAADRLELWRVALGMIGVLGRSPLVFWRRLPALRNFRARVATPARIFADTLAIYRDPGLPAGSFLVAFPAMGGLSVVQLSSASLVRAALRVGPERDRRDLPSSTWSAPGPRRRAAACRARAGRCCG